MNAKRPTIMTRNSKSCLTTTCLTLILISSCISMGSTYAGVAYELESGVRYKGSQRPPHQSYRSNSRNCNSSVRLLSHSLRRTGFVPYMATEDPDVENAPVVPEMGTIELQAFRCQIQRTVPYPNYITNRLRQGRVSERSKKAGWHHVK